MPPSEHLETRLNPQQRRFVEEYIKDPSARRAALKAGYSINSADSIGCHLLKRPAIKQLIEDAEDEAAKEMGVNTLRVLQELSRVAFANVKDILKQDEKGNLYVDMKDIDHGTAAGISEISITTAPNGIQTTKVKLIDKNVALEKLGKFLHLFKDQLEITGDVNLLELVNASIEAQKLSQPNPPQIIEAEYEVLPVVVEKDSSDVYTQALSLSE